MTGATPLCAEVPTWVSPPSLDNAPVQSPEVFADHLVEPLAPPIVVPLPSGLETGALCLGAMAARRWWKRTRPQTAKRSLP